MTLWYLRKDGEPRRKLIDRETAQEAVEACGDEEAVILAGQEVWTALFSLPREPGDWESVDEETGAFILDHTGINGFLHARIDSEAGAFRGRFLTTIIGQQSAYRRKEAEARALVAGGEGPWPMIEAEAAATGVELAHLAAAIIAGADTWADLEPKIEAARLGAKKAVAGATTAAEKLAAAAVEWERLADRGKQIAPLGGKKEGA